MHTLPLPVETERNYEMKQNAGKKKIMRISAVEI